MEETRIVKKHITRYQATVIDTTIVVHGYYVFDTYLNKHFLMVNEKYGLKQYEIDIDTLEIYKPVKMSMQFDLSGKYVTETWEPNISQIKDQILNQISKPKSDFKDFLQFQNEIINTDVDTDLENTLVIDSMMKLLKEQEEYIINKRRRY